MLPQEAGRTDAAPSWFPRGCGGGVTIVRRFVLLSAPLWLLLPALATEAHADDGFVEFVEVTGRLSPETRLYPETAEYAGQRSHASGLAAEMTLYMEDEDGRSITVTPEPLAEFRI